MRPHKYIKRTGAPGNYQYWYMNDKGQLEAATDPADKKHFAEDHARRAIVEHAKVGNINTHGIAQETGVGHRRIQELASNMAQRGRNRKTRAGEEFSGDRHEAILNGHDYTSAHLLEARHHHDELDADHYKELTDALHEHHKGQPAKKKASKPKVDEKPSEPAKVDKPAKPRQKPSTDPVERDKQMHGGISGEEYEKRVSAYENEGMTRSDAQGVVDAELMNKDKKPESPQKPDAPKGKMSKEEVHKLLKEKHGIDLDAIHAEHQKNEAEKAKPKAKKKSKAEEAQDKLKATIEEQKKKEAEDFANAPTVRGKVKHWDDKKGYGHIVDENGVEHFTHYSGLNVEGFKTLEPGSHVTFKPIKGSKGMTAQAVTPVKHGEGPIKAGESAVDYQRRRDQENRDYDKKLAEEKKQTKKSFSLVVDIQEPYFVSERDIRKSMIEKIRRLKNGK